MVTDTPDVRREATPVFFVSSGKQEGRKSLNCSFTKPGNNPINKKNEDK